MTDALKIWSMWCGDLMEEWGPRMDTCAHVYEMPVLGHRIGLPSMLVSTSSSSGAWVGHQQVEWSTSGSSTTQPSGGS